MKHRSVIAFILIAAALFAAPQISHDLSALKSAIGARLRGEILHAILNLPAGDGANEIVTHTAGPALASYAAKYNTCPITQQYLGRKSEGRTQAASRDVRTTETENQPSIFINPSNAPEKIRARLQSVEAGIGLGNIAELTQNALSSGDVAMLNMPDSDFDLPSFADAIPSGPAEKAAADWRKKTVEAQRHVAFMTTSFEQKGMTKSNAEDLRLRGPLLTESELSRVLEKGMRVKVLKLMRSNRSGVESKVVKPQLSKPNTQPPVPVAALVPPDMWLTTASCAKSDE